MSDLARWELRGPVRTLRTLLAEWNPEAGDWRPLKNRLIATLRPDGQLAEIEHHNPDGSLPREVRVYDAGGRLTDKTKVVFIPVPESSGAGMHTTRKAAGLKVSAGWGSCPKSA